MTAAGPVRVAAGNQGWAAWRLQRRDHRREAVWPRLSSAARLVAAHRSRARQRAERSTWTWWMAGKRVWMVATWAVAASREAVPAAATTRNGAGATGRSAGASSACCFIADLRLGVPPDAQRARSTDPCRTSMPINAESGNHVLGKCLFADATNPSIPGGGHWPTG